MHDAAPPLPADPPARLDESRAATERAGLAALLALLACLVVFLPTLGRQSLWLDEVISADAIRMGWGGLVAERLENGHFPTYFALMKGLGLDGGSEFLFRLPAALLMAAAGGLVAMMALRLSGAVAAATSTILFALSPLMILYAQEARPYSLLVLFLCLAMVGQIALIEDRPRPRLHAALATVGAVGAVLSLPAAIVSVALQHLALPCCGTRRLSAEARLALRRHVLASWLLIGTASALLLPNVLLRAAEPRGLLKWQAAMPVGERIGDIVSGTYGFRFPHDADRFLPGSLDKLLALGFLALIGFGLFARRRDPVHRYLAAGALGTPVLFIGLATFSATAGRYLLGMMPAAFLLAGSGAASIALRPRWRLAALGLAAIFTAMLALQALDALLSETKYDWRRVAAFLHEGGVRGATLLSDKPEIERVLGHYLPVADGIGYDVIGFALEPAATLWNRAAAADPAWLVLPSGEMPPASVTGGRTVCRWPFGEVSVVAVARQAAELPAGLRSCPAGNG